MYSVWTHGFFFKTACIKITYNNINRRNNFSKLTLGVLPIGNLSNALQSQSFNAKLDILQCTLQWIPEIELNTQLFTNDSVPYGLRGRKAHNVRLMSISKSNCFNY